MAATRRLVFAPSPADLAHELEALQADHQEDYLAIFQAARGLPVTIRLLSPPLRDFLPPASSGDAAPHEAASRADAPDTPQPPPAAAAAAMGDAIAEKEGANPLLRFRGRRLRAAYPAIASAQVCSAPIPSVHKSSQDPWV